MARSSSRSRKISQVPSLLEKRLSLYSLAASAAGLSVLALAQPADAKIVYTKTHHVIGLHHPYKLDLTHDGSADFLIQETQTGSMGFLVNRLGVTEPPGNEVEGYAHDSRRYAPALKKGASIGGRQRFVRGGRFGQEMAEVQQSDTVFYKYYGPWTKVSNRYLGLKFKIHGKTHYGWARLSVADRGFTLTAILTGYAYETIPGKPIIAGNTNGTVNDSTNAGFAPSTSVMRPIDDPQVASLGTLAMGAHGLSIWRKTNAAIAPPFGPRHEPTL